MLYSRLLTADQYWTLLHLKSTGEIAVFLNDTAGYKNLLPVLVNAQTHRIDLENAIRSVVLSEGKTILSALSGERMAAAVVTSIACLAAGYAVANVGSAAIGLIGEKPEMLGATLIYLGLAEGIAIYGLIVSLLILQKL